MKNFIPFNEMDMGGGIDAQSPETNIPASFASDIKDMDPQPRGSISKRKGYEAMGGSLPLRVNAVTQSGADVCFSLDDSVDVTQLRDRPILVSGIDSSFNRNAGAETYFPTISTQVEKSLVPATDLVIPATDHGYSHDKLLVQIYLSTGSGHEVIIPDELEIDDSTYAITIKHSLTETTPVFVVIQASPDEVGVSHTETVTGDQTSINIPAATHQLDHLQIIAEISINVSGSGKWVTFYEDELSINAAGDVDVTFAGAPGVVGDSVRVVLRAAEIANIVTGTVPPTTTASIDIINPPTSFQFISVFVEDGTDVLRVIPESIVHDSGTNTTSVTFINEGSGESFEIYYEDAALESNEICVPGTLPTPGEWTNPDSVIWGILDFSTLPESTQSDGAAFKTHALATYSSEGLRFPVASLQGSPMQLDIDAHDSLFPRMSSRVDGDQILAPFFSDPGQGGRIESSAANQGRLDVVSVVWVSGTLVDVVVNAPDLVTNDLTLVRDRLTLTNCARSTNEGTWDITSISAGVDSLTIRVNIPDRIDDLDDELDTGAFAAIYTDSLLVQDITIFLPDDKLQGDGLETSDFVILGQDNFTLHVDNVRSYKLMSGGLRVRAVRSDVKVLPIRNADRDAQVDPFVAGDSLTFTGHARRIRAGKVSPAADSSVTITQDNDSLIVAVTDSSKYDVGQTILLHDAGDFAGAHVITSILSDTQLTVSKPAASPSSGSAILMGSVIDLDESLSSISDDGLTQIYRPTRWMPVPTVSGDVVPWQAHSPSDQPTLKAALSRDHLHFAGGDDPIYKFDGIEMSRTGIPRIQCSLFMNQETTSTGKIVLDNPSADFSKSEGNKFVLDLADDLLTFRVGERIVDSRDGSIYTVEEIGTTTNRHVMIDRSVSHTPETGAGTLTRTVTYSYYARINMIDNKGGLVGSAAVGSEDMKIELSVDAGVHLRLSNFPALDSFDFEKLEIEIFRTLANQVGPYYRLTTLPLKNEPGSYVDYLDTAQDAVFTNADLDEISTAIEGVELGTQWECPLPSKYITSVGNRLVAAHSQGWPTIDYRLRRNVVTVSAVNLAGMTLGLKRDNTAASDDQLFEYVSTSTTTANAVAGVIGGLTADTMYYLFTDSTDDNLIGCGWYLSDGSGDIDVGDASFTGTRESVKATLATTIPVYVHDLSGTSDRNWPKTSLVGAPASVEGQAAIRMAGAINWWQTTLTDAWMTAASGGEFAWGQLVLKVPRYDSTLFEGTWTANGADVDVFANGLLRTDAEQVSAFIRLFPSRIISSEKNFPDIFNNPETDIDVQSRGVIDVNPDDGEEITGISSFFGDSTTSASQMQSTLIAFKESSIYAVDLDTGEEQRLETEGKGCTVPGSIVSTKGGIMYANLSGIYLLTPQFQTVFVGRRFDRKWKELGTADYSSAAGSLRNNENKWLLTIGDTTIVYDTTRTYESGVGSFSTYTNHDATVWTSFGDEHIWSSKRGTVCVPRDNNEDEDYSDEGISVSSQLTWRPMAFGDPTKTKVVSDITSHCRILTDESTLQVSTQMDLSGNFLPCDSITLTQATGGLAGRTLKSIRSSSPTPRGLFFSLRWENTETKPFELSGFGVRVAGINGKGAEES
jgi:hypothetical protein